MSQLNEAKSMTEQKTPEQVNQLTAGKLLDNTLLCKQYKSKNAFLQLK